MSTGNQYYFFVYCALTLFLSETCTELIASGITAINVLQTIYSNNTDKHFLRERNK